MDVDKTRELLNRAAYSLGLVRGIIGSGDARNAEARLTELETTLVEIVSTLKWSTTYGANPRDGFSLRRGPTVLSVDVGFFAW